MRDDFSSAVKDKLAMRVGHVCSNPQCRAPTSGPSANSLEARSNVGVAAHISAASPKGPRYDQRLTSAQRRAISNAIWLCQNCGKKVDDDKSTHTEAQLLAWKQLAEIRAKERLGLANPDRQVSSIDKWMGVMGIAAVHALLIGGLAVFALWPGYFERLDLSKSLFIAILLTWPFSAIGAGIIYFGAMDRRPLEPEIRYSITFATCTVAVCQIAALLQMFFADVRSMHQMVLWGLVGAGLCSLPAWAKRKEYEEDERDRRLGITGQKSFFRGKRKGGS